MNYPIIKNSVKNIIKQPLTILVLVVEIFIITTSTFFVSFVYSGNQIRSIEVFNYFIDEPYIFTKIITNAIIMFLFFLNFITILIASRFFSESFNDSLLDIILPKLKSKAEYFYSTFLGFMIFFGINNLLFTSILGSIYQIKLSHNIFIDITHNYFILLTLTIYIASIIPAIVFIFDGFTASIVLLIPLFFSGLIISWTGNNNLIIQIFLYIFPFELLNNQGVGIISGESVFNFESILVFITPALSLFAGKKLFVKQWQ